MHVHQLLQYAARPQGLQTQGYSLGQLSVCNKTYEQFLQTVLKISLKIQGHSFDATAAYTLLGSLSIIYLPWLQELSPIQPR